VRNESIQGRRGALAVLDEVFDGEAGTAFLEGIPDQVCGG
jgi:hypothetical protein